MSTVFMPLNRKMRDVIVGGVHLLEEDQVPGHLLTLCAHVSAYEAIIASWEEGNYSDNKPSIPFPREDLRIYANNSYIKLKNRQSKLLSQNGLIGALIWMMRRVPLHPRAH
jgi:hypothetical protein